MVEAKPPVTSMVSQAQQPPTTSPPSEILPQLHHPYPMPASQTGAAGQTNWAAAAMAVAAADLADPIHHLRFGDFPFPGGLAAFRKYLHKFT